MLWQPMKNPPPLLTMVLPWSVFNNTADGRPVIKQVYFRRK